MTKITAIQKDKHADLRVINKPDFSVVAGQNIIPVVVQEFIPASIEFPIVFVKHPKTDDFQAVIMSGIKPNENIFTDGTGWDGMFLPSIIAHAPFKLMQDPNNPKKLILAVDEDSKLVNNTQGEALFEGGVETAYLKDRQQSIINYFEFGQLTHAFTQMLVSLDLLKEQSVSVQIKGEKINLEGLHIVDQEKLDALPEDKFLDLRKRGFLPVIYAHMASVNNLHRLVKIKNMAE